MKKKIFIGIAIVAVLGVALFFSLRGRKNVVAVQTGKVERRDLATVVSASGEIKPLKYVNVGANAFGKIVKLHVKEGEQVKRGQLLAQLENVQSAADVDAQRAGVNVASVEAQAAEAGYRTALADIKRARADADRAASEFERAENLFKNQLISKAEYDVKKTTADAAQAGVAQAEARLAQTKAQIDAARGRIGQTRATLTRASDQLSKTTYLAPYDGVVTNLPVREGETVVVGIQNSPGSTLMTIADLSVITAEVKVDETDIVNVKVGQPADVTIDAIPGKTFKGVVSEIGNIAVLRSSGLATSQTTAGSQEAKDFKVVITLQEPPPNLRPGLSATAKITTATRENTLAIPMQALTVRSRGDLEESAKKGSVQAAAPKSKDAKEELQGVFVLKGQGRNQKAEFVQVETGITGTTEIEVVKGLNEGDTIVTGSYKTLRTLRNGAPVKPEKPAVKKEDEAS